MRKPAPTDVPLNEIVRERWSPRAFSDKLVPPEALRSLFEAARWAPSSSNLQPWSYLVATRDDPENFAKMLSTLVEFNAGWAKHAPVLVLSVAQVKTPKDGTPNRHALHDVGRATAPLTCEAHSRELGSLSLPSPWATLVMRKRCPAPCASASWPHEHASRSTNLS